MSIATTALEDRSLLLKGIVSQIVTVIRDDFSTESYCWLRIGGRMFKAWYDDDGLPMLHTNSREAIKKYL